MKKQSPKKKQASRAPEPTVFAVTGRGEPAAVARQLAKGLRLSTGSAERVERRYLDTFDWRLWRGGGELMVERGAAGQVLRWRPADGSEVTAAVPGAPRRQRDLPPGAVAREAGPRLGVRALLPMATVQIHRRCSTVRNADGKTVARLWWERGTAADSSGAAGPVRSVVRVELLHGYEREGRAAAAAVARMKWASPAAEDELTWAAGLRGRRPGDYSSRIAVPLERETPAAEAVRAILAHLRETAAANVAGVLDDLDTEFLHDLRVAVRRARSALGQLRGAYDPTALEPLREELRWVGTVTGPCRDLDVFVLDLEKWDAEVAATERPALAPLIRVVERERAAAQAELAGRLRSARFRQAMALWRRVTARPWRPEADAAPEAGRDALSFGAERVRRAYRRMRKRGTGLDATTPAAVVHQLRIDGKKLRYLLEFFAAVLGGATPALVKELRGLQDELGAFNDLAVQQRRLEEMAQAAITEGDADAAALMAAGRLSALMAARQQERREALEHRLAGFFAKEVRAEVARLGDGAGKGA